MNNASRQLYVTTTSEQDQFTIDNYSKRVYQFEEGAPVEDYFRIGGYFGSYGPHLFATAPQMFDLLEAIRDADEDSKRDGLPRFLPGYIRAALDIVLKQAQGEQA